MGEQRVSTVYLGQYTEERAQKIAEALDEAGIVWWHKQTGRLAKVLFAGDWGIRLFVDALRLDEAKEIARRLGG